MPDICAKISVLFGTSLVVSKNSERFVTIGEASKLKGVSIDTLRRWEQEIYTWSEKLQAAQESVDNGVSR